MYQLTSASAPRAFDVPAEHDWRRLWRAIARRRRLFVTTALVTFVLVALYALLAPKSYTTHVKLIAGSGGSGASSDTTQTPNATLPLLNALLAATGAQTSETYAELFQENPVADQVIRQLNLHMTPSELLSHVKVAPVVNTTLLDLAVTWSSPQMSARIANAFAAAFVDRERELVGNQASSAISTLTAQLPAAQAKAAAATAALSQYQSRNDMADLQTQTQNTMNAAAALEAKIQATQVDRQQALAQLSSVRGQLAHMESTVNGASSTAPNPVAAQLQQQLAQVTVQLQVAEQQYTDQHPTVINLKRQQAQLQHELANTPQTVVAQSNTMPNPVYQQLTQQAATAQAQAAADEAELAQLNAQHAAMRPQLAALPGKAARLLDLQRQAKLAEDVLSALQTKLNDANISKTTALSDVTITAPANAAEASSKPNRVLDLVLGALLSLVLATVVTLLTFVFDRRLRDEQQIEEELELPLLASVPELSDLRNQLPIGGRKMLPAGDEAAVKTGPENETWKRAFAVESFLQLVTSLRYSATSDKRLRCITFTSPSQGDGKSTVALNAAITMAHVEPRVLLIDADLRRPSLHSKLRRELGRGLSDVLVGAAALRDVIEPTDYDGLDVIMSGTRTPNSVKLIQSTRFDEVLSDLLETYHTVIIDAPALSPVVDAAILANKSDATVMVASIDSTDSAEFKRAVAKLHAMGVTNIVGTVANRTKPSERVDYDDYFFVQHGAAAQPALR